MDIEYKKLTKQNLPEILSLYELVMNNLDRKDFFIPFTQDEVMRFGDDTFALIVGAYNNAKLVGLLWLFIEEETLKSYYESYFSSLKGVCSLEGALVHPEHRGHGIFNGLQKEIIKLAKELGYQKIISTVHPDNIASVKTLSKEFEIIKTVEKASGHLRHIMIKHL